MDVAVLCWNLFMHVEDCSVPFAQCSECPIVAVALIRVASSGTIIIGIVDGAFGSVVEISQEGAKLSCIVSEEDNMCFWS